MRPAPRPTEVGARHAQTRRMASRKSAKSRSGLPRWLIGIAGAALALVLVVAFFPWNALRGPLESYLSAQTGRNVKIHGDLTVKLAWHPWVDIGAISVANADWSDLPIMFYVDHVGMRVVPLSFFTRLRIPELRLDSPRLILEKSKDGQRNWVTSDEEIVLPLVGQVWVADGWTRYRDPKLRADVAAHVLTVAQQRWRRRARVRGPRRLLNGERFRVAGQGEGLGALREVAEPFSLTLPLEVQAPPTRGSTGRSCPNDPENVRGFLKVAGPDMAQLYPLLPTAIPWTPPYRVAGHLVAFAGPLAGNESGGQDGAERPRRHRDHRNRPAAAQGRRRPSVAAPRLSRSRRARRLAARPAGRRAERTRRRRRRPRPSASAFFRRCRSSSTACANSTPSFVSAARAFVSTACRWTTSTCAWSSTMACFATIRRRSASQAASSSLPARSTRARRCRSSTSGSKGAISISRAFFPELASPRGRAGRFGGYLKVAAAATPSRHRCGGARRRRAHHVGRRSQRAGAAAHQPRPRRRRTFILGGDKTAALHCAVTSFAIDDGTVTPHLLVVDTSAVRIDGEGTIDLDDEALAITLKAKSKQFSIFALRGPIVVGGTLKRPTVGPTVAPIAARVGVAAGLAARIAAARDPPVHRLRRRAGRRLPSVVERKSRGGAD